MCSIVPGNNLVGRRSTCPDLSAYFKIVSRVFPMTNGLLRLSRTPFPATKVAICSPAKTEWGGFCAPCHRMEMKPIVIRFKGPTQRSDSTLLERLPASSSTSGNRDRNLCVFEHRPRQPSICSLTPLARPSDLTDSGEFCPRCRPAS